MANFKIRIEIIGNPIGGPVKIVEWPALPMIGETVVLEDTLKYSVKEHVHDFKHGEVCVRVERKWD